MVAKERISVIHHRLQCEAIIHSVNGDRYPERDWVAIERK